MEMTRFGQSVLLECVECLERVFVRRFGDADIAKVDDLDSQRRKKGPELAKLSGAPRREEESSLQRPNATS